MEEEFEISELFKVLGDYTRLKIVRSIQKEEKCVGCIAQDVEVSPSAVSHQLRILKQSRIVKVRKEGKEVYYSLCDGHIDTILYIATEHIKERGI